MGKFKLKEKKNIPVFLFFAVFAFAILYICTASSPRYATNPWNDSNAFLTVGKAMANGITVYKDIFEQKGPLLYLIHAIAYFISNTSFTGVYVMQSLALSVTGFAAYKIASLYVGTGWSISSALLTCFTIVNSACYYYGDSAEEFCLPFLMISIYYFCRYFKNTEQDLPKRSVFFLVGFFAGCVAMIKFTVIGFWFAWAAYISLYTLFAKKDFKKAVINALVFLGGMAAALAPWVIYFAVNGALNDFIYTYFILNTTAYPSATEMSFVSRLIEPFGCILEAFSFSPILLCLGITGMILFLVTNIFTEKKFFSRISLPIMCLTGMYLIYFGLRTYSYYFTPMSAFTVFGFIFAAYLLQKISKKKEKAVSLILCCICVIAGFVRSDLSNVSSKYVARKGTQTVQIQAAEYIKSHNPNGKILNYRSLDNGVYLSANQVPQFKHFEHQNFDYDCYSENADEQNRYINEHLADFVAVSTHPSESIDDIYNENSTLHTDYNLVICEKFIIQPSRKVDIKYEKTFYLFELKTEFKK
ncbi:MAG: ArnT family glycosyltransferase [Acutalibacteraceae bacterium]